MKYSTNLVFLFLSKQTRVVSFLDDDESDRRFVSFFQTQTSLPDGRQLPFQNLGELALADAVAIENDSLRLSRRRGSRDLVEFFQNVEDHVLHVFDVFLTRRLNTDLGAIAECARIDTSHDGSNRRFGRILLIGTRMCHIRAHDDDLFR